MLRKILLGLLLTVGCSQLASANANSNFGYEGPSIVAVVDISDQRLAVYNSGVLLHKWKVSTGRRGYITPVGRYKPYRVHKMWRSRKYDNAPMPYSVFFHKGWAVHGTNAVSRLGRPASHGCVRLAPKNAKALYRLVRKYGMNDVEIVIRK
ncbi:L,D-transpeptidase [Breoghania sp.]|uniref:L,D-transpeptidase n=1 Tax=Breoghania sp. TaxID=2065378 RepID=UPI002AA893FC|nr:L,D-transpeptidase [Breoghania sp.]